VLKAEERMPVSRVLLIALGGATYDVLVPLATSGTMPNLARLLRSTALARLRFRGPCSESVVWATMLSGGGPDVHGLLDDCYLDHRQRQLLPGHGRTLSCRTLADLVTKAFPSAGQRDALLKGREAAAVELSDASGSASIWQQRPSNFAELSRGIARTEAAMRSATAQAQRIDHSGQWRLLQIRFAALDSLLHRLWHMLGIGDEPGGSRQWVAKTREAFRTLDDCLGTLMELAERRQAATVVVSPYGFCPFREKITLSELLRRRDLLHPARGTARVGYRLARLTCKLRQKFSAKPVRQPVNGLLAVDLRRARAVTLHGQTAALVYLNTPERFGTRVLTSARQREQAVADVWAALEEARHPVTDEPLFQEVYQTAARFECNPLARLWPDVVAIPAAGFYTRHRLDRNRNLMRTDCSLTAARTGEGLLMVHAPRVVLGEPRTAELADVAPTVLALLGLEPPASMSGRAVAELFEPEPSVVQRARHRELRTY
jgi:predicted AlkP superfamily phosphohydrolase/phosphomutase